MEMNAQVQTKALGLYWEKTSETVHGQEIHKRSSWRRERYHYESRSLQVHAKAVKSQLQTDLKNAALKATESQ